MKLADVIVVASLASPALARGNDLYVGLSSGPQSNFALVDGQTFAPIFGSTPSLLGANDAAWSHLGSTVFVARGTGSSIVRGVVGTWGTSWSTLFASSGPCIDIAYDRRTRRVYTLSGANAATRELIAIDADPASSTFGQQLGSTSGAGGVSAPAHFALSGDGRSAVVVPGLAAVGPVAFFDTDPTSANYLQVSGITFLPYDDSFASVVAVDFASQPTKLVVVMSGANFGEVAVYDRPSVAWLDQSVATPGLQNYHLPLAAPTHARLNGTDDRLLLCGAGAGGWCGKLALDLQNPSGWSFTQFAPGQLAGGAALALSTDSNLVAFAAVGPHRVAIVDVHTGAIVSNVPMPAAVQVLAWEEACPAPENYCTAGSSAHGCRAQITGTGRPSATSGSGFTLTVTGAEGQRQGMIFYGTAGRQALAWGATSSFLCLKLPTQRTLAMTAGGTLGACDGTLAVDWNAFIASHPSALGAPWTVGTLIEAQAWYRDPPSSKSTALSDALEFEVCP